MNTATAQDVLDAIQACKGIELELKAAEQFKEQALRVWRSTLMRGDRVWGHQAGVFVIGEIITDTKQVKHHVGSRFDDQMRLFVVEGKTLQENGGSEWDVFPMTPEREKQQELRDRLARLREGGLFVGLYRAPVSQALDALNAIEQALAQHGIPMPTAED